VLYLCAFGFGYKYFISKCFLSARALFGFECVLWMDEIGSVACALVTTSIGACVCISMPVCASDYLKAVCGVYRVLFSGLFVCGLFDGGGL